MKRQWMLIGLLGSIAAAQAADAYRWVDANGVVHYSDTAPPLEAKAELVHLRGTGNTAAAAPAIEDNTSDNEDPRKKSEKNPLQTAVGSVQGAEKRCADARANLEVLQRNGPVGLDTGGAGKPKPLDDNARQQQIFRAQTIIATYCK